MFGRLIVLHTACMPKSTAESWVKELNKLSKDLSASSIKNCLSSQKILVKTPLKVQIKNNFNSINWRVYFTWRVENKVVDRSPWVFADISVTSFSETIARLILMSGSASLRLLWALKDLLKGF